MISKAVFMDFLKGKVFPIFQMDKLNSRNGDGTRNEKSFPVSLPQCCKPWILEDLINIVIISPTITL